MSEYNLEYILVFPDGNTEKFLTNEPVSLTEQLRVQSKSKIYVVSGFSRLIERPAHGGELYSRGLKVMLEELS